MMMSKQTYGIRSEITDMTKICEACKSVFNDEDVVTERGRDIFGRDFQICPIHGCGGVIHEYSDIAAPTVYCLIDKGANIISFDPGSPFDIYSRIELKIDASFLPENIFSHLPEGFESNRISSYKEMSIVISCDVSSSDSKDDIYAEWLNKHQKLYRWSISLENNAFGIGAAIFDDSVNFFIPVDKVDKKSREGRALPKNPIELEIINNHDKIDK